MFGFLRGLRSLRTIKISHVLNPCSHSTKPGRPKRALLAFSGERSRSCEFLTERCQSSRRTGLACFRIVVSCAIVPVFNRSIPRPRIPAFLIATLLFTTFSLFTSPAPCRSESSTEGVRAIARKAASTLRGATVSFEGRNNSSLKDSDFSALAAAFQDEMQQRGIRILASGTSTKIVLTISGNLTSYLAIVKIEREGNEEVFLEALGRAIDPSPGEALPAATIHKEFLFAQEVPIVDVLVGDDNKSAASALGLREIYTYAFKNDRWAATRAPEILNHATLHREMRGFLYFEMDIGVAYFPGEICQLSLGRVGWDCQSFSGQIPVRGVSSDLLAKLKLAPWRSAAPFEHDGHTSLIVTGRDGAARLYEEGADPAVVSREWGSEIASVHSGCGLGTQILTTSKGDWTNPDKLGAIEIQNNGSAREVSPLLELPGPVIALHAAAIGMTEEASANKSAVAIVHNLQSGNYEAYRLTITCGN